MSETPEIKDLVKILQPYLKENEEIISQSTSYLTKPGENFGSTMLSLVVKTRNTITKEERELPLVAKMCPPNEVLNIMFQTHITFIKENSMYTEIVPELIKLQIENGIPEDEVIDVLPKCYGARISLDPNSTTVDSDALLILENLKIAGYTMGNQRIGYDLHTTKIVLQYLAYFHALPIALKMQKPEIFAKKVMPALKRINMNDSMGPEVVTNFQNVTLDTLGKCKELAPYIEKIRQALLDDVEYQSNAPAPRETFATAVHNDFWVNNMMLKLDESGKAQSIKMVDFQISLYHSLVHDLSFFLHTSVQNDVLKKHYDEFIKHYYEHFIAILKKVGCKLDESFSYENFLKEIEEISPKQFAHVVFMLKVLFSQQEAMVELKDYDPENFNKEGFVGQAYLDKVSTIILMYVEKNWL